MYLQEVVSEPRGRVASQKKDAQHVGATNPPQRDANRQVERVSAADGERGEHGGNDVDEDGSPELIVRRPERAADDEHVLVVLLGEEVEGELEEAREVADLAPSRDPEGGGGEDELLREHGRVHEAVDADLPLDEPDDDGGEGEADGSAEEGRGEGEPARAGDLEDDGRLLGLVVAVDDGSLGDGEGGLEERRGEDSTSEEEVDGDGELSVPGRARRTSVVALNEGDRQRT